MRIINTVKKILRVNHKKIFIHEPNYLHGNSLGDLFNSLLVLSQNKNDNKKYILLI